MENIAENTIVNKVANSPLVSLDPSAYLIKGEKVFLDLAPVLFQGMILREKDFRTFVKEHDWLQYEAKHVAVGCSAEAIIPNWAYMLAASKLTGIADTVSFGSLDNLNRLLADKAVANIDVSDFEDKKVVVKGCADTPEPEYLLTALTVRLLPVVQSLMYGEPCSTVPVYKKKRTK